MKQKSTRARSRGTRWLLLLALVAAAAMLLALSTGATTDVADAAKDGYNQIQAANMEALLRFIAADELEGRNTGDRGLNIAALFLESQYTLAGLTPAPGQNSMLQHFDVVENRFQDATLEIVGDGARSGLELFRDFVLISSHSQPAQATLAVRFAGYGFRSEDGSYDDFKSYDVARQALLVLEGQPEAFLKDGAPLSPAQSRALRKYKGKWAQEAGAAAILHISEPVSAESLARLRRILLRPKQRLAGEPEDIPRFMITTEAAEILLRPSGWRLDSLQAAVVTGKLPAPDLSTVSIISGANFESTQKRTQNVVAYLEGSDSKLKHEVVAFGAHYDHVGMNEQGEIYNGADDDGSGTVGMLEAARAFAANPQRPKRSMLFVSHTGEEQGLLGSLHYTNHPIVPLENTVAHLNIDMIGRNDPNSVYIIGSNFLSLELHQINETANGQVGLNLDYGYNELGDPNRFYYRSDHYNYAKHGIPIIFYFTGTHTDYHKPTDTVEKIDFQKMEKIVRLIYLTGWQAGNLDHRLSKDGLLLNTL